MDIIATDVTRIWPRMHRQAVGACIQACTSSLQNIGHLATTRIAQDRDLVEINAECGQR